MKAAWLAWSWGLGIGWEFAYFLRLAFPIGWALSRRGGGAADASLQPLLCYQWEGTQMEGGMYPLGHFVCSRRCLQRCSRKRGYFIYLAGFTIVSTHGCNKVCGTTPLLPAQTRAHNFCVPVALSLMSSSFASNRV